jgi:hypothetical protein
MVRTIAHLVVEGAGILNYVTNLAGLYRLWDKNYGPGVREQPMLL